MGARWNPRNVPAVYTALSREVALAEHARRLEVQSPRPSRGEFTLYRVRVSIVGVIDLRDAKVLETVGVTGEQLAADDFAACQMVGGAAAFVNFGGLIVPSVRYPQGDNLVILTKNQPADFLFEIEDKESVPLA